VPIFVSDAEYGSHKKDALSPMVLDGLDELGTKVGFVGPGVGREEGPEGAGVENVGWFEG
jgi:hypothetical protein